MVRVKKLKISLNISFLSTRAPRTVGRTLVYAYPSPLCTSIVTQIGAACVAVFRSNHISALNTPTPLGNTIIPLKLMYLSGIW